MCLISAATEENFRVDQGSLTGPQATGDEASPQVITMKQEREKRTNV